jgi:hypothetical protein
LKRTPQYAIITDYSIETPWKPRFHTEMQVKTLVLSIVSSPGGGIGRRTRFRS